MKLSLIATSLVAAVAAASPQLSSRDYKPAKIGSTVEIYVTNGTYNYIGCVGPAGRFTRDLQWCGLFRSFPTTGVKSELWYYDYCFNTNGVLDCTKGDDTGAQEFYSTKGWITADGPTGYNFSIDTFPNATDRTGVPIYFGSVGKAAPLILHWRSKQG